MCRDRDIRPQSQCHGQERGSGARPDKGSLVDSAGLCVSKILDSVRKFCGSTRLGCESAAWFWGSLGPTFHANLARPATEWQVSVEGGLKFFSAIEKGEISDELMLRLWHKEKTTWLVACDHCDSQIFRSALAGGWSAERSSIPSELLDLASNSNMIFVRGLISDEGQEMGVFAFGERWWLPA